MSNFVWRMTNGHVWDECNKDGPPIWSPDRNGGGFAAGELIAQAPALLARAERAEAQRDALLKACKAISKDATECEMHGEPSMVDGITWDQIVTLRAAIAQATNPSPTEWVGIGESTCSHFAASNPRHKPSPACANTRRPIDSSRANTGKAAKAAPSAAWCRPKSKHAAYPIRWGIPEEIAHLEDIIFERLQNGDSARWPVDFLEAIPDGADLSMVWPRFALALLSDPASPLAKGLGIRDNVDAAVKGVADLYREWIDSGMKPEKPRWRAAADAAWRAADTAAAADAAWRAADAADAAGAAWRAAGAADAADGAGAAADAAGAAWRAAGAADAADGADDAAWLWMRDLLLRLLSEAPVPGNA